MLENRQEVKMPRLRPQGVPLDGCRVLISIAVRQPLNAPSDGSSTPWCSCPVSSSDCPNCCRAVTSAFVSPLRALTLSATYQRDGPRNFKGVNTYHYSYVHSVVQSSLRMVIQFLPPLRNLARTPGLSKAIRSHMTGAVCPLHTQYVRRKSLRSGATYLVYDCTPAGELSIAEFGSPYEDHPGKSLR